MQLSPALPPSPDGTLIVANSAIRRDAEGRYCLNDLHRAAGGEKRHQPSDWLRLGQTQELIAESEKPGFPGIESKQGLGTFVCKELVYAYAMWISAPFSMRVIRAYDSMVTQSRSAVAALPNFMDPAAAAMAWAEQYKARQVAEQNVQRLADQSAEQATKILADAPKLVAFERLCTAEGSLCLRDSAKALQVMPSRLIKFMNERGWIHRRAGKRGWLGYQDKVQSGHLTHRATTYFVDDEGSDRIAEQVRVTAKGLARLAVMIERKPDMGLKQSARR